LREPAGAAAVMSHGPFGPAVEPIRDRLGKVKLWRGADDGSPPRPDWAEDLAAAAEAPVAGPVRGPWGRSGADRWFLYTGGTTGGPKGVMWEQDTMLRLGSEAHPLKIGDDTTLAPFRGQVPGLAAAPPVLLPTAPLMRGTVH